MIDLMGKIGDAAMTTGYGWSDQFPYDGSAGEIWTEAHAEVDHPRGRGHPGHACLDAEADEPDQLAGPPDRA